MDYDLYLVVGLVLSVFAVPSVVSALSENRTPRIAALVVMLGGGLVVWAVTSKAGGYSLDEIPDVIVSVFARYLG
ncbi:hypothetical protein [uncultured Lentibacter sp.]|uniref:hypothetical protein n=1 Tax=uncultured Lentibacter sp. TaxID=1659309 RepID=UPI002620F031|nr:hypothetical protein [uncultured Lentibacter sp.]